jgi:hypothetical protein
MAVTGRYRVTLPIGSEDVGKFGGGHFHMKKVAYVAILLLAISTLATFALAQATTPNNVYRAWYDEKDPAKKTQLAEQFVTNPDPAFKASQYLVTLYQQAYSDYVKAQNWAKVMELADKLATLVPTADDKLKNYVYVQTMAVANQTDNAAKTIEYGEKLLATDAGNLQALMIVPSAILSSLPTAEPAKGAALTKASDYAKKMLAAPKPAGVADADWAGVQGQAHFTVGVAHLSKSAYNDAITEFDAAVKLNKKDDQSQYNLGLAYNGLLPDAQKQVLAAYEAENAAKTSNQDQATIDGLAAKRTSLENEFKAKRDLAIDAFGRAVAIGGPAAAPARTIFERLFKQKNENATADEINQFIAQKKAELG